MKTEKFKKKTVAKGILFSLLMVCMMLVVPVSAEETSIFTIEGKTTNVFFNEGGKTFSTVEYGPLNIPNGLLNGNDEQKSETTTSESKYSLVTFNDPIPKRTDVISLPITLYGKDYVAELKRMDFEELDDGIDSYIGSISSISDSIVMITVGDTNVIHGSIELANDYISIFPVQNREYGSKTSAPLHIIYSENDVVYPDTEQLSFCGTDESLFQDISEMMKTINSDMTRAGPNDWAYVNLIVVADTAFYNMDQSWKIAAQTYISQANYQFQRSDIKIVLHATEYDDSRSSSLTLHSQSLTSPWNSAAAVYPSSYLYSRNADICLYLGGSALVGTNSNYLGATIPRYSWVRMPGQPWPLWYDGSDYARVAVIIHELGHQFAGTHDQAYSWWNSQSTMYGGIGQKYTVLTDGYRGQSLGQLREFSSISYQGNAQHDNALIMRNAKHTVSSWRYNN